MTWGWMDAVAAVRSTGRNVRKPRAMQGPRKRNRRNNHGISDFRFQISDLVMRKVPQSAISNLQSSIIYVSPAESLQKGGEARLALWESGGRPPYFHRDEAGQEVARGTDSLHRDR